MDIEKTMRFILEQRAASDAALQKLEERGVVLQENMIRLANTVEHIIERQDRQEDWMTALTESHVRLAGTMRELGESQKHTDERLSALIDIVGDSRRPSA